MSSSTPRESRPPTTLLLGLLASVALAACGSRGEPAQPPPTTPATGVAAHDVAAHDHGDHDHGAAAGGAASGGSPGAATDDAGAGGTAAAGTGAVTATDPELDPAGPPYALPSADPAPRHAALLNAEWAAYQGAKPVLETYCASCHQQGGKKATAKKLKHFDMTSYPFTGHHADELGPTMRKVMGLAGKKPTMPYGKPGIVKGDELARLAAWADAWDAAHAGGAHGPAPAAGHQHHH